MASKAKKISEFYEVVSDEGIIKYDDFKKAQEKLKRLHQGEYFGYIIKREINEDGKVLSETFIG